MMIYFLSFTDMMTPEYERALKNHNHFRMKEMDRLAKAEYEREFSKVKDRKPSYF
jgi:hypothetical protein